MNKENETKPIPWQPILDCNGGVLYAFEGLRQFRSKEGWIMEDEVQANNQNVINQMALHYKLKRK